MLDQTLYWLTSIPPDGRRYVGDKAFYLGRTAQHGHPIVPGVVISTTVFRDFIQGVSWSDPLFEDFPNSKLYLDTGQPWQLQSIAKQIQQAITTTPLPGEWEAFLIKTGQSLQSPYLICRPSLSVAAHDGTTLSSKIQGLLSPHYCRTEPEAIAQAVKRTWAEAFRAKSLFVWQRAGISLRSLQIGVLIQPIYPALASGTIQRRGDRLEVEACWGLGLAMKTGEVIPDRYSIHVKSGTLDAQTLGQKFYAYGRLGDDCPESWTSIPSSERREANRRETNRWETNRRDMQMNAGANILSYDNVLSHYEVKHSYQQKAILSHPTLSTLAALHQSLAQQLDHDLLVEWVLGTSPAVLEPFPSENSPPYPILTTTLDNQQAWLYLTQVVPKTQPSHSSPVLPQSIVPESIQTPSQKSESPQASSSTSSAPLATPVITALGAAPGQAIAPVWVVDERPHQSVTHLPTGYILVASDVTPDWILDIKRAVALVSERGGMTCHAAIVARELGMPAVVGAEQVTHLLKTGDRVLINGDRGTIHRIDSALDPVIESGVESSERSIAHPPLTSSDAVERETAPVPYPHRTHPHRTQLMVSVSQVESLTRLRTLPIDGIGLLRGELLLPTLLNRQSLNEWIQSGQKETFVNYLGDRLRPFLEVVYPRPVYYRTADLRSQEFVDLIGHPSDDDPSAHSFPKPAMEQNPLLGSHGTLSYLHHPTLFQLELAGLYQLRQAGYDNIHVMLPFVRTVEEFVACRQFILKANLLEFPGFQVWIMAEVPSVLFLMPEYVEAGISGIAIGTNDLTQLMLAIDRNQSSLSAGLDPRHPAVMRAMRHLVTTAQQLSIPCAICGEAPGQYPELIQHFVEWGVTSISVSPGAVEKTHRAIAQAEQSLSLSPKHP